MQFVKESIFVSAIRSFFNGFLAMIGVMIGFVALLGVLMAFSGAGPLTLPADNFIMEILPDAEGSTTVLTATAPVILQIDIRGIVGLNELISGYVETALRMSQHSPFIKPERIKGIFVNIDSPGGAATDSDEIHQALVRYKEMYKVPVHAFASGFCASGGYMIACAADKISAARTCLVGSVGVRTGPFFNYYELMDKYGVKAVELSKGKNKIKYPSFTPIPKEGDKDSTESYQDLIDTTDQLYTYFAELVANSRQAHGLTKELLMQTYGAQIYLGPKSQKLGYVDEGDSYYQKALRELVQAAGIEQGSSYQVIRFKRKASFIESLTSNAYKVWTLCTKNLFYGSPHEGSFDKKMLYYCDAFDSSL